MTLELFSTLALSPNLGRQLSQLRDDMGDGRSVLSVAPRFAVDYVFRLGGDMLPDVFDTEFLTPLSDALSEPIECVRRRFQIAPPRALLDPLRSLMEADLPQVIILQGLDALRPEDKRRWLAFLGEWGRAANSFASIAHRPPPALWLVTSLNGMAEAPAEEPYLRVRWWWAVLSALDVRIICRHNRAAYDSDFTADAWREALAPALVGDDLDLLERLWPVLDRPSGMLYQTLQLAAHERGWKRSSLQSLGLEAYLQQEYSRRPRYVKLPEEKVAALWLAGLLCQTPEYGLQASPAALAELGFYPRIDHLLWRGQSSLLLPLLDEWRLNICEELTRRYGVEWPLEWATAPNEEEQLAVINTPLATQWGHLQLAITNSPKRLPSRLPGRVYFARKLRNDLAHYHPVEYERYVQLVELMSTPDFP